MKKIFTLLSSLATSVTMAQSVPNGGFEQWQSFSYEYPMYYQTSNYGEESGGIVNGVNAQKITSSYHGQYAAMLESILYNAPSGALDTAFAFIANGNPGGSNGAAGGIPINQKPTGVRFYYEYNSAYSNNNMSATPDSGLAIFEFKKSGLIIGQYIYKLVPTNSSPGYVLFNPSFSLTTVPDSVVVAFASSSNVMNNGKGQPGSVLFIDSISFTGISSQPAKLNGDMENWIPVTKDMVFGWNNSRNYTRTTDKYSGNYAIQLTTMQPLMAPSLNPGEASSASSDGLGGPFGGYPFSNQTDTLVFYYKYYPANYPTSVDTASAMLQFRKNNAPIGGAYRNLTYTNVYKKVEIPFNVGQAPDTMSISFMSSKNWPTQQSYNGSILYIDEVYLKSQKTPISFFGGIAPDGCVGDTIHLMDLSSNAPNSWQWFMTGANPASTSTQQNPKILYTNPGTYTISMQACDSFGCGGFFTRTINIHALPQIQASAATVCANTSATLTVNNTLLTADSAGASPYFWYDNTGIIANGTSVALTPSTTTMYTVTGTSQYGCTNTAITSITALQAPVPSICMVSTDSLSQYNIIYYDKTMYNNVDSFIAYREVAATYKRIGAQPYSALSQFIDTAFSVGGPNGGNPNTGTYRYKIQTVDTCGNYSALSPYHNTIFIIQGTNGQFSWSTPYQIEGAASPDTSYVLMCDTANVNVWTNIASVSGSQQTVADPGFIYHATIANWRVDGLGFNCDPTMRIANSGGNSTMAARVKSHSNSTNNRTTGIKQLLNDREELSIYPNPANTVLNVQCSANSLQLSVFDVLGNELIKQQSVLNKKATVDVSTLQSGVYFIKVGNNTQKFIKQ